MTPGLEKRMGSFILLVSDALAADYFHLWKSYSASELVQKVLKRSDWWGSDLSLLPGFEQAVREFLLLIQHAGVKKTLQEILNKKDYEL